MRLDHDRSRSPIATLAPPIASVEVRASGAARRHRSEAEEPYPVRVLIGLPRHAVRGTPRDSTQLVSDRVFDELGSHST